MIFTKYKGPGAPHKGDQPAARSSTPWYGCPEPGGLKIKIDPNIPYDPYHQDSEKGPLVLETPPDEVFGASDLRLHWGSFLWVSL